MTCSCGARNNPKATTCWQCEIPLQPATPAESRPSTKQTDQDRLADYRNRQPRFKTGTMADAMLRAMVSERRCL